MGDFVNLSIAVCNKSVAYRFGRSRKASRFAAAASIANFGNDVISPLVARDWRWRTRGLSEAAERKQPSVKCAGHALMDANRASGIKALALLYRVET